MTQRTYTNRSYLDALEKKVLVFDGAMGTSLQLQNLTAKHFGGEQYNGCNEYLVFSKPSAVERIHVDYFTAGADVVESNTFGATSIVLAEYNLADRAFEINLTAARLARRVANEFSAPERPRFVAGSMGPTTKLPSQETAGLESNSALRVQVQQVLRRINHYCLSLRIDAPANLLCERNQDLPPLR